MKAYPAIFNFLHILSLMAYMWGCALAEVIPHTVKTEPLILKEDQRDPMVVMLENPLPRAILFEDVIFEPRDAPLKLFLTNNRIPASRSLSVSLVLKEGAWPEEDVGMTLVFQCVQGERLKFQVPIQREMKDRWAVSSFVKASVEGEIFLFDLQTSQNGKEQFDFSKMRSDSGRVLEYLEIDPGSTKVLFQPDPLTLASPSIHFLKIPVFPPENDRSELIVTVADYKQWDGGIQPVILEPGPDRGAVSFSRLKLGSFSLQAIEPHENIRVELVSDRQGLVMKLTHLQNAQPGKTDVIHLQLTDSTGQDLRVPLPVIIGENSSFDTMYAGTIPTTGRRSGSCGCH